MVKVVLEVSGVLYDKTARTQRPVHLKAGGTIIEVADPPIIDPGPIEPPNGGNGGNGGNGDKPPNGGGGVPPLGIWPRPGDPDFPGKPPDLPPAVKPPQPGDPTQPLPPPAGSAGWPVQPIVPPPFILVTYPGIGPVVVSPPAMPEPTH